MNPHEDHHAHDHSMNCAEVVQKVYAFLDGELTLEEIAVYKDHLQACLPCKDYVRFEEKLVQVIQEKGAGPEIRLPESLLSRIKNALSQAGASTD